MSGAGTATNEPPSQSLPSGTRLEEFVIERVLGSGGFGITYLARDSRLGRQVVIKENLPVEICWRDPTSLTVGPRHSQEDDEDLFRYSLENFEKEAATLASLDHSGIVKVLRSFEANGTAYFVMPFVEGYTFDILIKERHTQGESFSEEELSGMLWRVLDALAYLHDRGIYHRDIKPGNILITATGDPMLIDFGAARQRLSERSLTVIESPGYTPFEQMQSRGKVGPWSDLYALGGTLYKAITGETPAKATDRAFEDPQVPLAERAALKGQYSEGFLASIDKAMTSQASQRIQNAREWVELTETRQMPSLQEEGAGADEMSVAQLASASSEGSPLPMGKSASQLQFLRVGLAVGVITIAAMFVIGSKYRDKTPISQTPGQAGAPDGRAESELAAPHRAIPEDQLPATPLAEDSATDSSSDHGVAQERLAQSSVATATVETSALAGPPEEGAASMSSSESQPPPLNEEPLPAALRNVWEIVKVGGTDYVTGQSLQQFYRFSTHKVDGLQVWFRNPNLILKAQIGGQELLVNNIKFIMSYPVLSQGGQALFSRLDLCKLIEPVIRPNYIGSDQNFDTVVLDAGHGGEDSGVKGIYGYEKNYALAMVLVVRDALQKRGFQVFLTRSDDSHLSEAARVMKANRTPKSIFISIHFNKGEDDESGIETFALTPQGSSSSDEVDFSESAVEGNQFDSENIALATAVHAQVVHRFKLIDRGIKRSRSSELTGLTRPGILLNGGFLTNPRECQLIASDVYRRAVADAIGDAALNFRRALNPGSSNPSPFPSSFGKPSDKDEPNGTEKVR